MSSVSIIKKTVRLLAIQCILLVMVLLALLSVIYYTASEDLKTNARNMVEVYGRSMQGTMEKVDSMLEQLIYNNDNYALLQSESESVRYFASVELNGRIADSAAYAGYVDAVAVAEKNYDICLYYDNNDDLSMDSGNALREFTMNLAKQEYVKSCWNVEQIGDRPYVYKMYVWNGKAVAVYISAEQFIDVTAEEDIDGTTLILTDGRGMVWGTRGEQENIQSVGEPLREVSSFAFVSEQYELEKEKLVLMEYVSRSAIISQFSVSMAGVLLFVLILGFFTYHMVRYIHRQIMHPIKDMQNSMEQIWKGDMELRITGQYEGKEFITLKNTFNRLMDEIMNLKITAYEKQIEFQEAELKAVKLQIRPHFFLNAMTTISSLSQQEENAKITSYINALSKNIRYMFRSGLHTVPLSEEIKHVENYFEMQEMKYPDNVFYNIEADPETYDWPVPQMLIHTIIENEYKYAVNVGQVLTILIKVSVWENQGERLLILEIEDDGDGYPEEVLDQFSSTPEEGKRIGLWSLRKIMALMYERNNLFTIRNIEPHGCKNTFIIPRKPVHQIQEMKQME